MRNGQCWRVFAVDPEHQQVAARRREDGDCTVLSGDYLCQHITHGYAITVHSAQSVTVDITHAVLGDTTTRALLYMALTRGGIEHLPTCMSAAAAPPSTNTPKSQGCT